MNRPRELIMIAFIEPTKNRPTLLRGGGFRPLRVRLLP